MYRMFGDKGDNIWDTTETSSWGTKCQSLPLANFVNLSGSKTSLSSFWERIEEASFSINTALILPTPSSCVHIPWCKICPLSLLGSHAQKHSRFWISHLYFLYLLMTCRQEMISILSHATNTSLNLFKVLNFFCSTSLNTKLKWRI